MSRRARRSTATEAGGNLSSPAEEGSTSARRKQDRPAQTGAGDEAEETTRPKFRAAQIAAVDANAPRIMRDRRRAALRRFMRAARLILRPVVSFHKARGGRRGKATTTGKGKATGDARAFRLDKDEHRVARRVAFLRRIFGAKPKEARTPAPVRQTFARQRSPPRRDHR